MQIIIGAQGVQIKQDGLSRTIVFERYPHTGELKLRGGTLRKLAKRLADDRLSLNSAKTEWDKSMLYDIIGRCKAVYSNYFIRVDGTPLLTQKEHLEECLRKEKSIEGRFTNNADGDGMFVGTNRYIEDTDNGLQKIVYTQDAVPTESQPLSLPSPVQQAETNNDAVQQAETNNDAVVGAKYLSVKASHESSMVDNVFKIDLTDMKGLERDEQRKYEIKFFPKLDGEGYLSKITVVTSEKEIDVTEGDVTEETKKTESLTKSKKISLIFDKGNIRLTVSIGKDGTPNIDVLFMVFKGYNLRGMSGHTFYNIPTYKFKKQSDEYYGILWSPMFANFTETVLKVIFKMTDKKIKPDQRAFFVLLNGIRQRSATMPVQKDDVADKMSMIIIKKPLVKEDNMRMAIPKFIDGFGMTEKSFSANYAGKVWLDTKMEHERIPELKAYFIPDEGGPILPPKDFIINENLQDSDIDKLPITDKSKELIKDRKWTTAYMCILSSYIDSETYVYKTETKARATYYPAVMYNELVFRSNTSLTEPPSTEPMLTDPSDGQSLGGPAESSGPIGGGNIQNTGVTPVPNTSAFPDITMTDQEASGFMQQQTSVAGGASTMDIDLSDIPEILGTAADGAVFRGNQPQTNGMGPNGAPIGGVNNLYQIADNFVADLTAAADTSPFPDMDVDIQGYPAAAVNEAISMANQPQTSGGVGPGGATGGLMAVDPNEQQTRSSPNTATATLNQMIDTWSSISDFS